jgi:hypothetical protein
MNTPQLHAKQHPCQKESFLNKRAFEMSFLILLREQHLCSALPEYLVPLSTGCGGGHLKGVLYDGDKIHTYFKTDA